MIQQKTMTGRAWAELLILSVIWGGSFLSVEFALREIGIFTIVAERVALAALVLWAVILIRRRKLPRRPAIWGAFLVMGILNNALPFTLLTYGQVYIESGLTAILNATTAIFGVLLAAMMFRDERLTLKKAIGVTIGFCGVATAIGPAALQNFDPRAVAQLAVIGATLSYGFAGVWARRFLSGLPSDMAAAGMLTGSSLIMVPLALMLEGRPSFDLATETFVAMGFYAIIATALAYLLYYRVLAMAGSGNLMLVTLFVPVVAIFLGALVLNEALGQNALLGFGIMALGMIVLDGRVLARLRKSLSI
jgi:drug/metabolite transporter (DMT)-like permease